MRTMKMSVVMSAAAVMLCAFAAPGNEIRLNVDPAVECGPIKPMNAVNNGPAIPPVAGDQPRGNFLAYKQARLPYARLHDSVNCVSGGAKTVDVTAIFSDFDADETDPANYDFTFTDLYLKTIRDAGTKIFYRLGQTIEHGPKKYGIVPPKDFAKWARICEHIIRHYTEGWADGFTWDIEYWEIWNEPDLDAENDGWKKHPRTWQGTEEQFFEFYATAAKHLKSKFPHLKIGGPAVAGNKRWEMKFLTYMRERNVPIDFYSWHVYANTTQIPADKATVVRGWLDEAGYKDTESILNEWNYVEGWGMDFLYTLRTQSGDQNLKSAAFVAGVFCACQDRPVDMLMYYDARANSVMNGMFERVTLWPMKGYYPFVCWSKLAELGTQVKTDFSGVKPDQYGDVNLRSTAAKGADGKLAVFVSRYNRDNNAVMPEKVLFCAPAGYSFGRARCHLTDTAHIHTEVPFELTADGSALLRMEPLSFALIEFDR